MIKRPTFEQVRDVACSLHIHMSEQEIRDYMELMEATFQAYDRIDELPDNLPEVAYPRVQWYFPSPSENPLNAWTSPCVHFIYSKILTTGHQFFSCKEIKHVGSFGCKADVR